MAQVSDHTLKTLAMQVADSLKAANMALATAESCTGGWVAKLMTDLAGSSHWFERGFVTYSNISKQEMLGVPADILDTHGAVSEATVRAMAEGALQHSHADISIAISGIAGPGGATADKPLGTVWFAWGHRHPEAGIQLDSEGCRFDGEREAVRRQAVQHVMQGILKTVSGLQVEV